MSCVSGGISGALCPSVVTVPVSGGAPPVTFFLQLAGGAGLILLAGSAGNIVLAGH